MTQTARLYGGSLYDLAAEEQLADVVLEQMREIQDIFLKNPDYVKLLGEPAIPTAERIRLIEEAFGAQAERYLVNFIKLLCERKLLGEYAGCCREFTRRYYADHGIVEAVVTGAAALTEAQISSLTKKLEAISGKKVSLVCRTDPSLLAGLRVEMEGKLLDGTAQSRLSGISAKLNEIVV